MTSPRRLDDDLGFLVARANAVLTKATNRVLAPLGLKVRAYSVLAAVCDQPGGIAQRRLANDVGLDPSQIVALVDELEGRELVQRTTDPTDRRNKLIVATDAGVALCVQARERGADVVAEHLGDVHPDTLETVRMVLRRITFDESVARR